MKKHFTVYMDGNTIEPQHTFLHDTIMVEVSTMVKIYRRTMLFKWRSGWYNVGGCGEHERYYKQK